MPWLLNSRLVLRFDLRLAKLVKCRGASENLVAETFAKNHSRETPRVSTSGAKNTIHPVVRDAALRIRQAGHYRGFVSELGNRTYGPANSRLRQKETVRTITQLPN